MRIKTTKEKDISKWSTLAVPKHEDSDGWMIVGNICQGVELYFDTVQEVDHMIEMLRTVKAEYVEKNGGES